MSKEYKNIDDLFRDRFENLEVSPPAHIWENVKTGIAANNGGNTGGKPFMGGITGISILLITTGLISFFILTNSFTMNEEFSETHSIENQDNYLAVNSITESSTDIQTPERNTNAISVFEENNTEDEIQNSRKNKRSSKKEIKSKKAKVTIDANVTDPVPVEKEGKLALTVNREQLNINPMSTDQNTKISFESNKSDNFISLSNTFQTSPTKFDKYEGKKRRNDYVKNGSWKLGLYFTPEMIVYPSDDGLKNYSKTLEANISHHNNNLIFQTGIGVSLVTDEGNNHIDYRKHLGSYEDVYDVIVDSTNTGWEITYLTETVHVYDSVQSEIITPTKRKFTYIQIPALFGYGKEGRRFGWFVKGGPSLLLLIDENIPVVSMGKTSDMMVDSESTLPGRIRTHWQFIMSVGANYKLGNRISLSVEPSFRYHINSAYENSNLNTKHPYAIGLRTGLIYNF